jgi:DNA-binding transcriptional ArsR family regulator
MSAARPLPPLTRIDRLVHEPARLMVLTILAGAEAVEFRFIEELTGLSRGNLSSHMTKLENAELITVEKSFRGKVPVTTLRITEAGRRALRAYRECLAEVIASIPVASVKRG